VARWSNNTNSGHKERKKQTDREFDEQFGLYTIFPSVCTTEMHDLLSLDFSLLFPSSWLLATL